MQTYRNDPFSRLTNSLESIAPFTATVTTADRDHAEEGNRTYYYSTEHGPLRVVVVHSMCKAVDKTAQEIETLDLLPRGFPANAPIPIVRPNTAVDNGLRHRLRHFAADLAEPLGVPTIEPSETARWFQRGH